MARFAHDDVLDALLDEIATSTTINVCSTQPTNYTEATSTYMLAATAVSSGDFTNADDTSGRKLTVSQQTDIDITNTGTAQHIALCDATTLLFVTTCTAQGLTSGGTVTIPAFDINVQDPVAP